jgi:hypothetical protein
VGGKLGGGVFGFPSLSFSDGLQEQDGSGWNVRVVGCRAFPHVGAVSGAVGGLDADGFEELPNERAALGPVVVEGFVRPFPGDEDAASGDAQVFGLVGFALAPPGCHGVPGAMGNDAIKQPHRTPWRAGGDAEFGVEAVGVVAVGVGGVFVEAGGVAYRFGQIFCEVSDVASCFFGAAEDAFDVDLLSEADDVGGFGEVLAGLVPARQGVPVWGSVKVLAWVSQTGRCSPW